MPLSTMPFHRLALGVFLVITVAAAQAQPLIQVDPPSLAQTLAPGSSDDHSLLVTNTGTAPLTFSAARGPASVLSGGPDAFGYTWAESGVPGGPLYQWVDVRATGTYHPMSSVGDVWVALPFAFPFYGQEYEQVRVYANGLISFFPTYQGSTSNNRPIPWWDHPSLFIAGFWDDLDPSRGGGIYTGTDPLGRFVVQYHEVAPAGGAPGRYTFQIILDASGDILLQYGPLTGATDSATVGIENANSTTGLEIVYNAPYVYDGLALSISRGDPWFAAPAAAQTLAPGASSTLPVTFSAVQMGAGEHASTLVLTSDDPTTPALSVPLALTVLSQPGVALSTEALAFGEVYVGATAADSVVVTNTGTAPLALTSVTASGGPFESELVGASTIEAGGSRVVRVRFAPTAPGAASGVLAVATDDPANALLEVALSGAGRAAPAVAVTPAALGVALAAGDSVTETVSIANEGTGELAFTLRFEGATGMGIDSLYYDFGWPQAGTTGFPPGQPAAAATRFTADGPFYLNAIRTALRFRQGGAVRASVYGAGSPGEPTSGPLLWQEDFAIPASSTVRLHEFPLGTTLVFEDGEDFYIVLEREDAGESPFGGHHLDSGRSYYRYHNGEWALATHTLTFVIRAVTGLTAALSAEPMAGAVAPGSTLDVALTIDGSALPGGLHEAALVVSSNDPLAPEVAVPLALDVSGMGGLTLTAETLDFGGVYVGAERALGLRLRNLGNAPVTVHAVASSDPAFAPAPTGPFTLPAGASDSLHVTFSPGTAGPHAGTITVTSDDPEHPTLTFAVAGEGVDYPAIALAPDAIAFALEAGETGSTTFTITNAGDGPLHYTIEGLDGAEPAGEPDGFGYRWTDSRQDGGPVYEWVDISATATPLALSDNSSADVLLPFAFPFYGDEKMAVRIASNGYLTFGNQRGDVWQARPIPHNWPPNDYIAPYWTNINPEAGGSIYYGADGEGRFVVTYDSVATHGVDGWRTTFQVILDAGGNITFQYRSRTAPFSGTIGIENADATDGLQISHNVFPSFVQDRLAVRIDAPTPWLAAPGQASGTVPAGASAEVTVDLDASALEQGLYTAALRVASNDPARPMAVLPLTLEVAGAVVLRLDAGWNLISFNVAPEHTAIETLLAPILAHVEAVETYESGERRVFVPGLPDNSLTHLTPMAGYWIRLSQPATLLVAGEPVDPQHALPLAAGANVVPFLPWRPSGAEYALSTVADVTVSAAGFRGTGVTYAPSVPEAFHVADRMEPKAGYVLRTAAPATLVYPEGSGGHLPGAGERPTLEGRRQAEQAAGVTPTMAWLDVWGDNVLLASGSPVPVGALVTALRPDGTAVGAFETVAEGRIGLMPIYGDDPYTDAVDGALPGEPISLTVDGVPLAEVTWTAAGEIVDLSGLVVSNEPAGGAPPEAFGLRQNYPNPFSGATTIRFDLPEPGSVTLRVYDLLGREVATLVDGSLAAGTHEARWDANGAASGVYVYRLDVGERSAMRRMLVVR